MWLIVMHVSFSGCERYAVAQPVPGVEAQSDAEDRERDREPARHRADKPELIDGQINSEVADGAPRPCSSRLDRVPHFASNLITSRSAGANDGGLSVSLFQCG
jgi:hypothetical protein